MLIDSHCHLADQAFQADLTEVVERARAAGLSRAMCIISADEPEEVDRAGEVARAWSDVAFATGVHPHHAGTFAGRAERAADVAAAAVDRTGAVALGEVGLDYHYDFSPRDVQRDVFAVQLELARQRGLPVVIHTREATEDTMATLCAVPGIRGVMHCFSGSIDEARQALDLGFHISLSGIVTFPKAQSLRDVAAFVPADRLLVETDAPYLAPVPYRGKRNEPAWVARTAEVIAGVRSVSPAALGEQAAANFLSLVGLAR